MGDNQKEKFIQLLAEVLERDENLINILDEFRDYEEWDSLAILSFMVMLEEEYSTSINRSNLDGCLTIKDLFQLVNSD